MKLRCERRLGEMLAAMKATGEMAEGQPRTVGTPRQYLWDGVETGKKSKVVGLTLCPILALTVTSLPAPSGSRGCRKRSLRQSLHKPKQMNKPLIFLLTAYRHSFILLA